MNREQLLNILPLRLERKKRCRQSDVRDIVKEVLDAHEQFAPDYDLIAECFAGPDALERLFDFCKYNLRNDTEGEDLQTTASPTVLLEKGHCDCKGYAGFIGESWMRLIELELNLNGVIGSLNMTIRTASYTIMYL